MSTVNRIITTIMTLASIASAQEGCLTPTSISLGDNSAEPCIWQQVSIPVYMDNSCPVGGFEIHIAPSDLSRFRFDLSTPSTADRIGGRITNWELFLSHAEGTNGSELVVFGIADLPGGQPSVYLPPGNGLLFTAHLNFQIYSSSDTNLFITTTVANVADTTGYILFDVDSQGNFVHVLSSPCDLNPRGDCNCDATRNGIDVVYLVSYLKGAPVSICGGCGGNANNSGAVNGIDVTFMVSYLKGIGPTPVPCD